MSISSRDADDYLEVIRHKFVIKIKDNLGLFNAFLSNIQTNNASTEDYVGVRFIIHQIAGTALTFGFPGISENASLVEKYLDEIVDKKPSKNSKNELNSSFSELLENLKKLVSERNIHQPPIELVEKVTNGEDVHFNFTIVIADDDELVCDLIKKNLENDSINCISVYEGKKALSVIKNTLPDLVILDVNLPGMGGFEILKELQLEAKFKSIPVVMLTKRSDDNSIIEGINDGAIDYITKPFEVENLSSMIRELLEQCSTKILLVDDDSTVRELLTLFFQKMGFSVSSVSNGKLALDFCRVNKTDLIILDQIMPEMDGLSAMKKIHQEVSVDIAVIFLTYQSQIQSIVDAFNSGSSDYITKPFHLDELKARVLSVLRARRKSNNQQELAKER